MTVRYLSAAPRVESSRVSERCRGERVRRARGAPAAVACRVVGVVRAPCSAVRLWGQAREEVASPSYEVYAVELPSKYAVTPRTAPRPAPAPRTRGVDVWISGDTSACVSTRVGSPSSLTLRQGGPPHHRAVGHLRESATHRPAFARRRRPTQEQRPGLAQSARFLPVRRARQQNARSTINGPPICSWRDLTAAGAADPGASWATAAELEPCHGRRRAAGPDSREGWRRAMQTSSPPAR